MAAAFEWSPGGCCCGDLPGWFDSYSYTTPNDAQAFQRQAIAMLPLGKAYSYGSRTNINWFIGTPSVSFTTHLGVTSRNEKVWSHDNIGGVGLFSLYDAVAKTRAFQIARSAAVVLDRRPADYQPINDFGACSDTYYASGNAFTNPAIRIVDAAGGVTDWPALSPTRVLAGGWNEIVQLVAGLEWPKASMVRYRTIAGPNFSQLIVELEFLIGDVEQAQNPAGLTLTNRQVIKQIPTPNIATAFSSPTWRGFDYYSGHWGGVINYQTQANLSAPVVHHFEILVDGIEVLNQTSSGSASLDWGSGGYGVHVCYPHESLGAGYILFGNWPNNGAVGSLRMTMCKGGTIVWQRPRTCKIYGSSDRWVYFRTESGIPIGTMSGGMFTRPGDNVQPADYWIARHDGSEIMPAGALTSTYRQLTGGISSPMSTAYFSMVRDSSAVPQSISGSYEEMWSARNG